jgi:hypothetical protein
MNQSKDPEWLIPGNEKQCLGNKYCAAIARFFPASLLCLGAPNAKLMGECSLCKRFICGRCAKKETLELKLATISLPVHWLACPKCGCHLGRAKEKAILWSSFFGVLVGGSFNAQELKPTTSFELSAVISKITIALARHQQHGDQLTYNALIAQNWSAKTLAALEEATLESPEEIIAWFYRALLYLKLGLDEHGDYPIPQPGQVSIKSQIATTFAMEQVRRLGQSSLMESQKRWLVQFPNVSSFWKEIADPVYEAISKW